MTKIKGEIVTLVKVILTTVKNHILDSSFKMKKHKQDLLN